MEPPPIQASRLIDPTSPYPYSLLISQSVSTVSFPSSQPHADQQLCEWNQKKIVITLKENKITARDDTISLICRIAQSVHSTFAILIKHSDSAKMSALGQVTSLPSSCMVVTERSEKRIYVSLKGRKLYDRRMCVTERKGIKVVECLLFRFDRENRFHSLEDLVKISFPFSRESGLPRRFSIMQHLGDSELYPKTYDFVLYPGKQGKDKVAFYQQKAFCDLLHLHNNILHLNALPQPKKIGKELLLTLLTMHQRGFVHRDVKLDNFLVFTQRLSPCDVTCSKKFCPTHQTIKPKLTDFEFTCTTNDSKELQRHVGTHSWAAPEVLSKETTELNGIALDTWGLGHIIYILSTGEPHEIHEHLRSLDKIKIEIQSLEQQITNFAHCQQALQNQLETKLRLLLEQRKKATPDRVPTREPQEIQRTRALLKKDISTLSTLLKSIVESPNDMALFILDRIDRAAFMRRLIRTLDNSALDSDELRTLMEETKNSLTQYLVSLKMPTLETDLSTFDLATPGSPSPTKDAQVARNEVIKSVQKLNGILEKIGVSTKSLTSFVYLKQPIIELLITILKNLANVSLTPEEHTQAKTQLEELLKEKNAEKSLVNEQIERVKKLLATPPKKITNLTELALSMLARDPEKRITLQAALNFFNDTLPPTPTNDQSTCTFL